MSDSIDADIARCKELDAKVTKGPFRAYANGGIYAEAESHSEKVAECFNPHLGFLFAEYRTLAPRLATACEELKAENERVRRERDILRSESESFRERGNILFAELEKQYRCFHCKAVFTTEIEARQHFGQLDEIPDCAQNLERITQLYRYREEECTELRGQRDAALAEVKELREELTDVRKVATECLDELETAQTVYRPRDHAPYWRWETTGEAVAGVEWDVTKDRATLPQKP